MSKMITSLMVVLCVVSTTAFGQSAPAPAPTTIQFVDGSTVETGVAIVTDKPVDGYVYQIRANRVVYRRKNDKSPWLFVSVDSITPAGLREIVQKVRKEFLATLTEKKPMPGSVTKTYTVYSTHEYAPVIVQDERNVDCRNTQRVFPEGAMVMLEKQLAKARKDLAAAQAAAKAKVSKTEADATVKVEAAQAATAKVEAALIQARKDLEAAKAEVARLTKANTTLEAKVTTQKEALDRMAGMPAMVQQLTRKGEQLEREKAAVERRLQTTSDALTAANRQHGTEIAGYKAQILTLEKIKAAARHQIDSDSRWAEVLKAAQ